MSTATATATSEPMHVVSVPMKEIFYDVDFNCRGEIIPLEVIDLAKNIQERGLIQPIIVQPYDKGPPGTKYRIVAGYRRFMAFRVNKSDYIDCIIRTGLTDDDAQFLNLSENLNRKDLNLMQEAKVLNKFFERGMTQQQVADKLNKSRSWVQYRLYAMRLPEPIQKEIEAGMIGAQHIHAMQGLSEEQQMSLVKEIKERKQNEGERIQVKMNKKMLKKDPKAKMIREKTQIIKMKEHILDTVGANIGTRALAWCAGDISSEELFGDIGELAQEKGIDYEPPTEDF